MRESRGQMRQAGAGRSTRAFTGERRPGSMSDHWSLNSLGITSGAEAELRRCHGAWAAQDGVMSQNLLADMVAGVRRRVAWAVGHQPRADVPVNVGTRVAPTS